MLEYIELYINHKKSCNMANNTICNINNALERFITFISDEQHHNPQLSLIDINKYFINNYLNTHNLVSSKIQTTHAITVDARLK